MHHWQLAELMQEVNQEVPEWLTRYASRASFGGDKKRSGGGSYGGRGRGSNYGGGYGGALSGGAVTSDQCLGVVN